jgi:transcriptional regulator with XRE-family HTH domain
MSGMSEQTRQRGEKFKIVYFHARFRGFYAPWAWISAPFGPVFAGSRLARVKEIMTGQERFGPNLRRLREQRGISLEQLADATNVDVELWAAMERNDFSRWPTGIFARAFVREYARTIGLDPESTVDEFCRNFPQGDRRRGELIRAEAALLGVPSEWHDDLSPAGRDRRRSLREAGGRAERAARQSLLVRRSRLIAAGLDLTVVAASGLLLARVTGAPPLVMLGGVAVAYHAASVLFFGATGGAAVVGAWLRQSAKGDARAAGPFAVPRLRRHLRTARS